jgi:hypothetical protein
MNNEISIRQLTCNIAGATALIISGSLHAATVVYEDINIIGSDKHKLSYQLETFEIEEFGTFQLTLTDFEFPNPFKKLGLTITDSTDKYAEVWGGGSVTFDAGPGDYYIGLVYKTKRRWDMGMYGVEISQLDFLDPNSSTINNQTSSVPLPASASLLLSGLAGIGFLNARRKKQS